MINVVGRWKTEIERVVLEVTFGSLVWNLELGRRYIIFYVIVSSFEFCEGVWSAVDVAKIGMW